MVNALFLDLWNIALFIPTLPAEGGLGEMEGAEYTPLKPPAATQP